MITKENFLQNSGKNTPCINFYLNFYLAIWYLMFCCIWAHLLNDLIHGKTITKSLRHWSRKKDETGRKYDHFGSIQANIRRNTQFGIWWFLWSKAISTIRRWKPLMVRKAKIIIKSVKDLSKSKSKRTSRCFKPFKVGKSYVIACKRECPKCGNNQRLFLIRLYHIRLCHD